METLAWIIVGGMVVTGWGWTAISAYDLRVKNEGLRTVIDDLRQKSSDRYHEGYQTGVQTSSEMLTTAVVTTVGDVTRLMMGEVVGDRETEVKRVDASGQSPDPAWYQWEDVDRPIEDIGVGDSVYVPRDFDDRVASIADGESIIPGVPLPDMSGEAFES